MPVSGVKADLIARLEEHDAASGQPTPTAAEAEAVAQEGANDAAAAPFESVPAGDTTGAAPATLAVKRAVEDDEAAEHVKRMRVDEEAAAAVPPANPIDSALPPAHSEAANEVPKVGDEADVTPAVIAESKVPAEALTAAAAAAPEEMNGAGNPKERLTDDDVSIAEADEPKREQADFVESGAKVEEEEEEEEPPVYDFEPEEEGGRPADLYLDTVGVLCCSMVLRGRRLRRLTHRRTAD